MPASKTHWEKIYRTKNATSVSWYRPHLKLSLELISASVKLNNSRIIDVGGGASTLADDLLDRGCRRVTVLDLSGEALNQAKKRLGNRAACVTWLEADITAAQLPIHSFDVWHDRAVFHFLTERVRRERYVQTLNQALKPQGFVVIAVFSLEGPTRCSGLDVIRYSPETLEKELGKSFRLLESRNESHETPFANRQEFIYCFFRKVE